MFHMERCSRNTLIIIIFIIYMNSIWIFVMSHVCPSGPHFYHLLIGLFLLVCLVDVFVSDVVSFRCLLVALSVFVCLFDGCFYMFICLCG